jgi:hypothetical protein
MSPPIPAKSPLFWFPNIPQEPSLFEILPENDFVLVTDFMMHLKMGKRFICVSMKPSFNSVYGNKFAEMRERI